MYKVIYRLDSSGDSQNIIEFDTQSYSDEYEDIEQRAIELIEIDLADGDSYEILAITKDDKVI